MKTVCAWCQKVLKEGPEPTSHGICQPCTEKFFPDFTPEIKNDHTTRM